MGRTVGQTEGRTFDGRKKLAPPRTTVSSAIIIIRVTIELFLITLVSYYLKVSASLLLKLSCLFFAFTMSNLTSQYCKSSY